MPVPQLEAPVPISFRGQYGPSRGSRKNPEAYKTSFQSIQGLTYISRKAVVGRGQAFAKHVLTRAGPWFGPVLGLWQLRDKGLLASLPGGMPWLAVKFGLKESHRRGRTPRWLVG